MLNKLAGLRMLNSVKKGIKNLEGMLEFYTFALAFKEGPFRREGPKGINKSGVRSVGS